MGWQKELRNSVTTIEQLKEYVKLSAKEETELRHVLNVHPMRVSQYYLSLIDWNNPNDPIKKMAIPSKEELDLTGLYDTSGEHENTKIKGVQHKYSGTVLLLSTNNCATYCRYCFRKRLIGLPTEEILHRFNSAAKYIQNHKEINNILISGGDPLTLPTKTIEKFLTQLSQIKHLDFIRFGTKILAALPSRITEDKNLLRLLESNSHIDRRIFFVTQFNHPNEITNKTLAAVDLLLKHKVIISNQTVLLKGVNDDYETMAALQNKLVSIGINPYYIFQCRPVKRVKNNFQVPLYKGYEIIEAAKKEMSGHGKRFHYVMSHHTGKIEILGIMDNYIYLKYHQARNEKDIGKIFKKKINQTASWLEDLE